MYLRKEENLLNTDILLTKYLNLLIKINLDFNNYVYYLFFENIIIISLIYIISIFILLKIYINTFNQ